jgi:PEP-CTERM motif
MLHALLAMLTLGLLMMPASASAIPICPAATMADYIAFGAAGCQFNSLTFSNFSYGEFSLFGDGLFFSAPAPPSLVSVQPRSDPASLGSGGAALTFLGSQQWFRVSLGFDVAGPGIVRNDLAGGLHNLADLQPFPLLFEGTEPGGSLTIFRTTGCSLGRDTFCPDRFASISFGATPFQQVFIAGNRVSGIDAGFATPEPATLLLVGAGVAGVGVVRWRKRRHMLTKAAALDKR